LKITPARIVLAFVALIISAAIPPLFLFTAPYFIYVVVTLTRQTRKLARDRDAYVDHAHTMRIGKFFADGGAK
jgi:hypothetical protein